MLTAIVIIAAIIFILILVLFAPAKIELTLKNTDLRARVIVFGIPIYKAQKSFFENEDGKPKKSEGESVEDKVILFEEDTMSFGEEIKLILEFWRSVKYLLKNYVTVKDLSLRFSVGTGDAATTAVSVGIMWAAVYNLLGIVSGIVDIDRQSVEISPDYSGQSFLLDGKGIIKTRMFMLYIYIYLKKNFVKIISRMGKED